MKKPYSFLLGAILWFSIFSSSLVDASEGQQIYNSIANKFTDKKTISIVQDRAEKYINTFSSHFDEWKGQHPKLEWEPVPYYADDNITPVVLEWKVSCSQVQDCGRVIISVDKNNPIVVESATSGWANYETLWKNRENLKNRLFYFSPFEQYIDTTEDQKENIVALSPGENLRKSVTRVVIQEKQKFNKELKKNFPKVPKPEYTQTWTTVVNVPGSNNGGTCNSPIPCYSQFSTTYWSQICAVWCGPTALTQIFAYHDRRGTFPNLFPNTVADGNNIDWTVANIIRGYMWTVCSWIEWATAFTSISNGMQYARDRGYTNTTNGSLITSNIFYNTRLQINNGRPVVINAWSSSQGHIFVAYWWNTDVVGMNQIHVNYGWWPSTPDAWITESYIEQLPNMRVLSILPVVIKQ